MAFTGNEDHEISLQDAAVLTKNFRDAQQSANPILGMYFSKAGIEQVLNQTGCVGIRVYYGLKEDAPESMIPTLIVCGVDANEDDMADGVLLDYGKTCPNNCSAANPLNAEIPDAS